MRIIQLSDIHLCKDNLEDLKNYYLEALINDLCSFHNHVPIDVILFTGDLVDKGGESLGKDPYDVFYNALIVPLLKSLNLRRENVLILPGNHDVNRKEIEDYNELGLCASLDSSSANNLLQQTELEFISANKRIERFKFFEKQFHKDNTNYSYSNNASAAIVSENGKKIGFALINDSWRCSALLTREQHFVGYNQLFNTGKQFAEEGTILNIAVFHHPLGAINENESDEIENILKSKKFDIAFFGHSHKHEAKSLNTAIGGYLTINGRAAFYQPNENNAKFLPGYNILDVDPEERTYTLSSRMFSRESGYRFDSDTIALPGGQESGVLPSIPTYYGLAKPEDSNNVDKALPNSYSADVHRIVTLLIGKSLYPNSYSFVRELIQNSVDACNRLRQRKTQAVPKIIININSKENYLEVADEGDGMTKNVVKNHFAVIGKSISQEFNDSTGNFNLISQFGIGFISTFIVAEKVVVNTKSDEDDQILFEINDVFKEFNYLKVTPETGMPNCGTTIRVYFKKGFQVSVALDHIRQYCRHIEDLQIYYDGNQQPLKQSWNVEDANHYYEFKTERYITKLCISVKPRTIIASNSGFLIATNPIPLIPFKFPIIIGGEVNFYPKGIDFDMSRTNIIQSDKSHNFRKNISISLRKLFRDALEAGEPLLINSIVQYLQYYLINYDINQSQISSSYSDFFSKKELINLCGNYTFLNYQGISQSVLDIIKSLKNQNKDSIFYIDGTVISDYHTILIQFLENKGYLVFKNMGVNVAFKDGFSYMTLLNALQPIAAECKINLIELNHVQDDVTKDMKMDKCNFHENIQNCFNKIESSHKVNIEVGKFCNLPKASVRNRNQIFINFDHETFQSLINDSNISDEILHIYLLGILCLSLPLRNKL
jgi:predicted MPP superfamily phosphohydrolase